MEIGNQVLNNSHVICGYLRSILGVCLCPRRHCCRPRHSHSYHSRKYRSFNVVHTQYILAKSLTQISLTLTSLTQVTPLISNILSHSRYIPFISRIFLSHTYHLIQCNSHSPQSTLSFSPVAHSHPAWPGTLNYSFLDSQFGKTSYVGLSGQLRPT